MNSERVSIEIVNDVRLDGGSTAFTKGSEFLVDANTAAALVLSGVAILLPTG